MLTLFIIGFTVGVLLTAIITIIAGRVRTTFGVIKIDSSNPEKDVYRLDIKDLDSLSTKKRVILQVEPGADLSQK